MGGRPTTPRVMRHPLAGGLLRRRRAARPVRHERALPLRPSRIAPVMSSMETSVSTPGTSSGEPVDLHDSSTLPLHLVGKLISLRRGARRRLIQRLDESLARMVLMSPPPVRRGSGPVSRSRALEPSDARGAPRVAVVDASMAREAWPGLDPVGRRFRFVDDDAWMTVVGVSAPIRGRGLARAPEPGFYIPFTQRPESSVELSVGASMALLVRARASVADLPGALREAVWAVEAGQPVPDIHALDELIAGSTTPERFRAVLVGAFAAGRRAAGRRGSGAGVGTTSRGGGRRAGRARGHLDRTLPRRAPLRRGRRGSGHHRLGGGGRAGDYPAGVRDPGVARHPDRGAGGAAGE
jgi:hypothetical protein